MTAPVGWFIGDMRSGGGSGVRSNRKGGSGRGDGDDKSEVMDKRVHTR